MKRTSPKLTSDQMNGANPSNQQQRLAPNARKNAKDTQTILLDPQSPYAYTSVATRGNNNNTVNTAFASRSPFLLQRYGALGGGVVKTAKYTWCSISWLCYICASLLLGFALACGAGTVALLLVLRHEAWEDYVPVECGPSVKTQTLSTVGFGSCNKHDEPQQFWEIVSESLRKESLLAEEHFASIDAKNEQTCKRKEIPSIFGSTTTPRRPADAFVWLGDVVYLDGNAFAKAGRNITEATAIAYSAMDVPMKGFEHISNPHYRAFKQSLVNKIGGDGEKEVDTRLRGESGRAAVPSRIVGTWDDHDMGSNDAGKEYQHRAHTKERFYDFLGVEKDDPLRSRDGIYSFHAVPATSMPVPTGPSTPPYVLSDHYENAFCVITLDVRTHRDPIVFSRRGDMLGEAQWAWFESILEKYVADENDGNGAEKTRKKRKCAATLIGGGIQVLSSEKPTEQWWNFKDNRVRLWATLKKYRISRAVLLSGDIHLMELLKADPSFTGLGYPMIDFTSSGLTHRTGRIFDVLMGWRRYLYTLFPMAIHCVPRGLTPVGNTDGGEGRACRSAFSLLPDWTYEVLFGPMDWRVGHYLGRNVGAVSLQVTIPSGNTEGKPKEPELSLRFAGYALSLEDMAEFMTFRNEGKSDDPRTIASVADQHYPAAEGEEGDDGNALVRSHAVTRHNEKFKVLEYIQPLSALQYREAPKGSEGEIDGSNHPWLKTFTFFFQSVAIATTNHPHARNLGVFASLMLHLVPAGMLLLWISAKIIRSCRGTTKRNKSKLIRKAKF